MDVSENLTRETSLKLEIAFTIEKNKKYYF
jgi:hypothetical protein